MGGKKTNKVKMLRTLLNKAGEKTQASEEMRGGAKGGCKKTVSRTARGGWQGTKPDFSTRAAEEWRNGREPEPVCFRGRTLI